VNLKRTIIAGFSACIIGCLGENGSHGIVEPIASNSATALLVEGGSAACTEPAWNSAATYIKDNKVSHIGNLYTAKWWTMGDDPASRSGSWDVWKLEGPCGIATVAPKISIPIPAANSHFLVGAEIRILALASGSQSQITRIDFLDAGSHIVHTAAFDQYEPYEEFIVTGLALGEYTYRAIAYDKRNKVSNTASISFSVQTGVAPTVAFIAPENHQYFYQNSWARKAVTVKASVNSNQTPIDSVRFTTQEWYIPGLGHSTFTNYVKTSPPYEFDYLPGLSMGWQTVVRAVSYSHGVASQEAATQFSVHPLPELTLVSPADNGAIPSSAVSVPVDVSVNTSLTIDSVVYVVTDVKMDRDSETRTTRRFRTTTPYDLDLPILVGIAYSNIAATAYGVSDFPERAGGESHKQSETKTIRINYNVDVRSCSVQAWNPGATYVQGNRVSKDGTDYEAKWWTRGEDPLLKSAAWDVWKTLGACAVK
jgi:chitodextrinase